MGSAVGRDQGLSTEKLAALSDPPASEVFSDVEQIALAYADAMTATPVDVPDALFEKLRLHFDERQLVELTSALAWQNYRARFDHALGFETEGFSEGTFCPLPVPPPAEASRAGSP